MPSQRGSARTALFLLAATGLALTRVDAAKAVALPFQASLTIHFAGIGPLTFTGAGIAVSDGPTGGSFQSLALPSFAVVTTGLLVPVTDPSAAPIHGALLTAYNPAATFTRTSGGTLGGTMPLAGTFKICVFAPCNAAIANLLVPLSPFGSAITVATNNLALGGMNTVRGAPWTTGTAAYGAISLGTVMGGAQGPGSGPSSTFAPGGQIQLVVPVLMTSFQAVTPGNARLTIDFVPEPATLALLGAGVAALAVAGRRRR